MFAGHAALNPANSLNLVNVADDLANCNTVTDPAWYLDSGATNHVTLGLPGFWGPAPVLSSQGYTYYLSILDDFTRFTWIFSVTVKSRTLQTFIEFQRMIENSLSKKIKCLQTDWGGGVKFHVHIVASKMV